MKRKWLTLLLFVFSFCVLGELDFRFATHEKRLEFQVDDDLYWVLAPNQTGFNWMAQMTQKSPPIHINAFGYRGSATPNTQNGINVLAVGSSSALGAGVRDQDTWTHQLQIILEQQIKEIQILNAANPGWGPFQHAKRIEKELEKGIPIDALLVMVSQGDFNFVPFRDLSQKEEYLKNARFRKKVLSVSPFLTYALRKSEVLIKRAQKNFTHWVLPAPRPSTRRMFNMSDVLNTHGSYWQKIVEIAHTKGLPTVFLVLNPKGTSLGQGLTDFLSEITEQDPLFQVVTVEPSSFKRPLGISTDQYVSEFLEIPNDGHPNAQYHLKMAQVVAPYIESLMPLKS